MTALDVLVQALSDDEFTRLYELFRCMTEKSWRVGPEYHVFCALSHERGRRIELAVSEVAV